MQKHVQYILHLILNKCNKVRDCTQTEGISQTDDSLSFIHSPQWCTLAYWEYRNRVGRLFPVYNDEINVFSHSPQGEGLCLEPLFSVSNAADDEAVQRTRKKIGFGITIRRDENGVWVYNRSKHAVFVDSPTLDPPNAKKLSVIKIMPGYSILAFNFACAQRYQLMSDADARDGPFDSYAFRISFAKGWGPDYTRQYITSCPCWLEVLLTSNLRVYAQSNSIDTDKLTNSEIGSIK